MSLKLTPRQQRFIAAYQIGMSALQAAVAAGYSKKSAKHAAYSLMHENPKVMAELERVRQELAAAAEYNGEKCMAELDSAITFAKENKQANAYVKAIELRARLAGLLRDKLDITVERVDLSGALEEAKARLVRPSCDPALPIEGQFEQLPTFASRRPTDD